jgi:ATP-dependent Lon protease
VSQFDQYVKLNKKIPPEILTSLSGIDEAGRLADTIAAHLPLKLEQKQEILEMFPVIERLEHLLAQLEARSTSCRSKSASVAASSARWRRASASTT